MLSKLAPLLLGALFITSPVIDTPSNNKRAVNNTSWTFSFDNIQKDTFYNISIPRDGTYTIAYVISCPSTPAWASTQQGLQLYLNQSTFIQLLPLQNQLTNYNFNIPFAISQLNRTDTLNCKFVASYIPNGSSLQISMYLGGYDDGYADGFEDGNAGAEGQYEAGYEQGYNQGLNDGQTTASGLEWIKLALGQVNEILQLEIFPGIRISYILAIPIIFSLIHFILGWFR